MSTQTKHSPTPWSNDGWNIYDENEEIGVMNHQSEAELVVACVNACASINPSNPTAVAEVLKELFEGLKEIMDTAVGNRHALELAYAKVYAAYEKATTPQP